MHRATAGGLVAAAVVALSGCMSMVFPEPKVALSGPTPIEMSYREARGGIVVLSGRVNGKADVDFILDTGAPVSVLIDGSRTTALGLDTRDARPLGDPSNPASPVGIIQGGFELAFSGVSLSELTVVVIPERALPCKERFDEINFGGVIGADLFRRFVVEIDPAAKRVRLHDPKGWQPAAGSAGLPITFRGNHPHVDVKVKLASGQEVAEEMNLDIGMNRALTLVAGSNPAIVMPTEGTVRKSCYVNGIREERLGPPVAVTLGGTTIQVESPIYSPFANVVGGRRNGSLGAGLFQGRRLTIDYPGRRVFIG